MLHVCIIPESEYTFRSGFHKSDLMCDILTCFSSPAFPEGTSGCLRSTRRPCTSGTQTSASKGRTICPCPSTGKGGTRPLSLRVASVALFKGCWRLEVISGRRWNPHASGLIPAWICLWCSYRLKTELMLLRCRNGVKVYLTCG